uniref:Chromosome 3 open reading frame 38 n=1 Tax=Paramormyrops kingsleyae TaxID=1676925 RepID=A0A3B3SK87_9TELE
MAGLTAIERDGFIQILGFLSEADLRGLCDTVTNRMIAVANAKEAREAILAYSQDAEELLKRKKVHRDVIFKYLAAQNVVVPPTSEKSQLVKATLQLWRSGKASRPAIEEKEDNSNVNVSDYLTLGKAFCQWFFQALNSQNPAKDQPPEPWGPQHFWENACLKLQSTMQAEQLDEFQGAELVSLRLLAMAREERLLFNPNLEPHGLKCVASPHGLVVVAVAGTIHKECFFMGIFEQVFGLIRSPFDNKNWKIKSLHLKIRHCDTLRGENLSSPALTCNSSQLQLYGQ